MTCLTDTDKGFGSLNTMVALNAILVSKDPGENTKQTPELVVRFEQIIYKASWGLTELETSAVHCPPRWSYPDDGRPYLQR